MSRPCVHCGQPATTVPVDLDNGMGAVYAHTSGTVYCHDDDSGTRAEPEPVSQHEAFLDAHADELDRKATAAEGTECPVCGAELARLYPGPWLRCLDGHTIRPWTDDETERMG